MNTEFRSSFAKDLRAIRNQRLRQHIRDIIELVEQAPSLENIPDLKKLRGSSGYYRIRIGEYRLGLMIKGSTVIFVRCLHRKEIYRYFP